MKQIGNGSSKQRHEQGLLRAKLECAIQKRSGLNWLIQSSEKWLPQAELLHPGIDRRDLLNGPFKQLGKVSDEIASTRKKLTYGPRRLYSRPSYPHVVPSAPGLPGNTDLSGFPNQPTFEKLVEQLQQMLSPSSIKDTIAPIRTQVIPIWCCPFNEVVKPVGAPDPHSTIDCPPEDRSALSGAMRPLDEPQRIGIKWDFALTAKALEVQAVALHGRLDLVFPPAPCHGTVYLWCRPELIAATEVTALPGETGPGLWGASNVKVDFLLHKKGDEVDPEDQQQYKDFCEGPVIVPEDRVVPDTEHGMSVAKGDELNLHFRISISLAVVQGVIDFGSGGCFSLWTVRDATEPGVFEHFLPAEKTSIGVWPGITFPPNTHSPSNRSRSVSVRSN